MSVTGTGEAPPIRLAGQVDLQFAADLKGGTRLRRRFRTGHFHVAKPYHDGRQLVAQVVNTTAGIFANDTLQSRFECGPGARACLISPSSSQIYTMNGEGEATSRQFIKVEGDGSLAVLPRWLVPHRGSRFEQVTRIDLDPDSRLFYLEPVSAGRFSHGEFLEMDRLTCRMDLAVGGKPVLVEKLQLGRDLQRWIMERGNNRFPYLATAYVHFPAAGEFCHRLIHEGLVDMSNLGLTALTDDLVIVRMLGRTCTEVTAVLKRLYSLLDEEVPLSPVLRRI